MEQNTWETLQMIIKLFVDEMVADFSDMLNCRSTSMQSKYPNSSQLHLKVIAYCLEPCAYRLMAGIRSRYSKARERSLPNASLQHGGFMRFATRFSSAVKSGHSEYVSKHYGNSSQASDTIWTPCTDTDIRI